MRRCRALRCKGGAGPRPPRQPRPRSFTPLEEDTDVGNEGGKKEAAGVEQERGLTSTPGAAAAAAGALADGARSAVERARDARDAMRAYHAAKDEEFMSHGRRDVYSTEDIVAKYQRERERPADQGSVIRIKDWRGNIVEYVQGDSSRTSDYVWRIANVAYVLLLMSLLFQIKAWGSARYFHDQLETIREDIEDYNVEWNENVAQEKVLQKYGWYYRYLNAVGERKTSDASSQDGLYEQSGRPEPYYKDGDFISGSWERSMQWRQFRESVPGVFRW
eukprot:Hpha_TRINITY_DN7055_c0_g1::TRINITY_DN7055_c0_g1_i1::g.22918::m.22918